MLSILLPVMHIHPPNCLGVVDLAEVYLGSLEIMMP
jgi:hypothetical protein